MTRGLSAAAKAYTGPAQWIAEIVSLEGATHYFWDGAGVLHDAALGIEKVVNGGFADGSNWTITGDDLAIAGGTLNWDAAVASWATQDVGIVEGKRYLVTYTVSSYTSGDIIPAVFLSASPFYFALTTRSAAGTYTEEFTAPAGVTGEFYIWGSGTHSIDNVSVKHLPHKPYLRINSPFRRTRSIQVDSGEIALDNTDLYIQTLLDSETFDGALCTVYRYLFGIQTKVFIMRGRLSEQVKGLDAVSWRLVSNFNPAETDTLALEFSSLCSWRFAKPPCGYTNASIALTETLAETEANIFSATYIGNSGLSMTVNEHADSFVLITTGTGAGQARRIRSNTGLSVYPYTPFSTVPDATSKFRIVTALYGLPKQMLTAATAVDIATADVHTARTIGYSGLAMVVNEHAITGEDALSAIVRIVAGTGSGQERDVKSNTATTITIADDEDDFSPVPDATSQFRILYARCPKDIGAACEQRGRTHGFNGAPTLTPGLHQIYRPEIEA